MVGPYHGSLPYVDPRKDSQVTVRYGDEYTAVTVESFQRWELDSSDVASDNKEQGHQLWVVPTLFCAMRYLNGPWNLPGDDDSMETWRLSPREAVLLRRAAALKSKGKHRKKCALQVVTPRHITAGVELFEDYSMNYWFE